jgi:hypothetical protein
MQQWYRCPTCGTSVSFGVKFCGNCGAQLNWPVQKQTTGMYEDRFQKRKSRGKIVGLSEISADFHSYIQGILAKDISIRKVDWMPCPRCGAKSTKSSQIRAPESGIGCGSVLLLVVIAVIAPLLIPVIITLLVFWVIAVVLATVAIIVVWFALLKRRGHQYSCAGCGFIWTGRDVELYLKESNPV